jgi:2-hydroxycyclohexanecarboxyl-CoA dehydrogenase
MAMQRNRTALVTGGGSGIGAAACLRLARDGYAVAVLGREAEGIASVSSRIGDLRGRAMAVQADVTNTHEIKAALEAIHETFGPIAILVNNAAMEDFTPFAEVDESLWDRVMAVNLKAVYQVTQAVLPDMIAAKWRRIINLTALGAEWGNEHGALYGQQGRCGRIRPLLGGGTGLEGNHCQQCLTGFCAHSHGPARN